MHDRVFLDTNIIVYLYSIDEEDKRAVSFKFVNNADCVTSIQAMNEAANVWFRKYGLSKNEIVKYLDEIESVCEDVMPVRRKTIDLAIDIKDRYDYSFFDCLMLASAIEANCNVILTEDMKNGQLINGTLKIENPFTEV
ncbi:MAG: PIN domain-containing protein [Defluviitaleaceae bacterium]|nr:PIN domain-containing protein [Defluviitaleaceae bacterium]MCL2240040.1 PIN domain-containing protein [Defluviitaleaceae bacterium]